MLEDFRQQTETGFTDEPESTQSDQENYTRPERPQGYFLGMSPAQRFFIALMLLLLTCLLSTFCLLVTQKVVPPFL